VNHIEAVFAYESGNRSPTFCIQLQLCQQIHTPNRTAQVRTSSCASSWFLHLDKQDGASVQMPVSASPPGTNHGRAMGSLVAAHTELVEGSGVDQLEFRIIIKNSGSISPSESTQKG